MYVCMHVQISKCVIDATANTIFHETDTNRRQQAYGPHTNTLGREIKSPIQMMDFELMTYTYLIMMCREKVI